MRTFLTPVIAAATLFALPAFAQNGSANTNGAQHNRGQIAAQVEKNLHHDLTKAGYTDIKIMPGSFLVHAKDSHGNPTEMMVNPYTVTEITAMNNSSNTSSADNSASNSNGSNGTSGQSASNGSGQDQNSNNQ
jgi:hypothetical protein